MKIVLLLLVIGAAFALPQNKINSNLAASFKKNGVANIFVSMREQISVPFASLKSKSYTSRDEQLNTVSQTFMDYAASSQKAVRDLLDSMKVSYTVLWITNQIYISNATEQIAKAVAAIENVREISEDFLLPLDNFESEIEPEVAEESSAWGLDAIEAPAAWELPGGNNGEGAIVGSIDTGVHLAHEALHDNHVGLYGWRDFSTFPSPIVHDYLGSGTHSTGIVVGGNGLGVAPGAKWMACKAFDRYGALFGSFLACLQFMACPTLIDGILPDCTKAPHVVYSSYLLGSGNDFYDDFLNLLHAANIIPVFPVGSSGGKCGAAESPGASSLGTIGVGATTNTTELAEFSDKGPGPLGIQKPDLVAPGTNILTAAHEEDENGNNYTVVSGTSVSAAHVAGVAALLKAHNPNVTFTEVHEIITSTASHNIVDSGASCSGIPETTFPNYGSGYGLVNARAALQKLINQSM